ncbi:MAG: hypothetical protein QOJ03_153, partial [Frankiaceae bacterium]|nr:hypothetical protein [Frankiaceae bacterium]
QDAVGGHAPHEIDAGDAGAGADLDNGPGGDRRGEEPQDPSTAGKDGYRTELGAAAARALQGVVLGEPALGELSSSPGGDDVVVCADACLLCQQSA